MPTGGCSYAEAMDQILPLLVFLCCSCFCFWGCCVCRGDELGELRQRVRELEARNVRDAAALRLSRERHRDRVDDLLELRQRLVP
jgi:hypothetical protein